MVWRIGLIGFGNVGQGFIRVLEEKKDILKEKYSFEFKLIGIADPIKGNAYDIKGLGLNDIITLLNRDGDIRKYSGEKSIDGLSLIEDENIDIIVEVTPTNLDTGEPGYTHIKRSLEYGKHVVTSNKGPIALAYHELKKIARERNVILRFEGTVLSGTPAISLVREALAGCDIKEIMGIVNGTTNFILTKMERGISYEEALKIAQEMGYAETDPTADVEGWDAAVKTVILANTLMGGDIILKNVERRGIIGITLEDVNEALKEKKRIKLLASITKKDNELMASVKPTKIPLAHPLANVMDVNNALTFRTDHLGEVTVIGPGAGRIQTGQALLSDMLYINRLFR